MALRPLYFVRRALDAMRRGPYVAIVGTATIFVAVYAIGLFAASLGGAQRLLGAWAGEVRIAVYLKPGTDLVLAREEAQRIAGERNVVAVPASAALRRLAETLGDQAHAPEGGGSARSRARRRWTTATRGSRSWSPSWRGPGSPRSSCSRPSGSPPRCWWPTPSGSPSS